MGSSTLESFFSLFNKLTAVFAPALFECQGFSQLQLASQSTSCFLSAHIRFVAGARIFMFQLVDGPR
jgi:hypothetical protein